MFFVVTDASQNSVRHCTKQSEHAHSQESNQTPAGYLNCFSCDAIDTLLYVNYLWVTKLAENVWVIVDNHTAKSVSHKMGHNRIATDNSCTKNQANVGRRFGLLLHFLTSWDEVT